MISLKQGVICAVTNGRRFGASRCVKDLDLHRCLRGFFTTSRSLNESSEHNEVVQYGIKEERSSKAMRAYLERSEAYSQFMEREQNEYKTGRRHLANMMGKDPESFTQKDVDEAIEYLFPSGLFTKRSKPIMKPPEEVHPPKKEAEFDETGRPFHFLFYTGKPNLYAYLHKLVETTRELNIFEDTMIRKQLKPDPALAMSSEGYQWLTKEEFEDRFIEDITPAEYRQLVATLERLVSHPYSYRAKDLIFDGRAVFQQLTNIADIPKPELAADGREFATYLDARRKTAHADVTVYSPGSGLVTINGQDFSYFPDFQSREQIHFPLQFTGLLNKVDVEATVWSGGASTQAGAVRIGLSMALRSFVPSDMIEQMRLVGLLTKDRRRRERKKPGQKKARRKFTWKKR